MEIIFDITKKNYIISKHAQLRLYERGEVTCDKVEEECFNLVNNGVLLLETANFRYIRNGNLFFPCKKNEYNYTVYIVTTVLLYDEMVKDRFQAIVELYQ